MTEHDVYPFYIAIGILGLLTVYQVHLSRSFMGNFKDKMYYYYSHLITLFVIILYIYKVINIHVFLTDSNFLEIFYMEWSITTPLTLMNIGRLIQFPIHKHILITLLDSLMILSGYISYVFDNPIVVYTSYGVGVMCYLILNYIFVSRFVIFNKNAKTKSTLSPTSIYRDSVRYHIYRAIVFTTVVSWTLYPITHMLYKQQIISLQATVDIFVGLDVLTKGIFTNLLLGSREIYRTPTSLLGYLTRKAFRIHPLEVKVSENVLEDIGSSILEERYERAEQPIVVSNSSNVYESQVIHVATLDTIYESKKARISQESKHSLSVVETIQ